MNKKINNLNIYAIKTNLIINNNSRKYNNIKLNNWRLNN